MSINLRNEAVGEGVDLCGEAWEKAATFQKLNWIARAGIDGRGMAMVLCLPWSMMPDSTKELLYSVWMEARS